MIVVLAAEPEADLEQIAGYVAEQSPRSALNLVRELRERCESLLHAPRGYPLVPRHEHLGIRRRSFGRFLIFYRIGGDTIEVIHILRDGGDYEPLLFPEELFQQAAFDTGRSSVGKGKVVPRKGLEPSRP